MKTFLHNRMVARRRSLCKRFPVNERGSDRYEKFSISSTWINGRPFWVAHHAIISCAISWQLSRYSTLHSYLRNPFPTLKGSRVYPSNK